MNESVRPGVSGQCADGRPQEADGSGRCAVRSRPGAAALALAVLWAGVWGAHHVRGEANQSGDDGRGILRFVPFSGTLEPVSPGEVKPGYIYSHFSPRLNRRVWSYVQPNGRFWYALGEGTTQEAWRLDLRVTVEQGWEILAQTAPRVARQLQQRGPGHVYLQLTSDGRWALAEGAGFPTIYNAETGYRWEKHSGRYIPVSHGAWRYDWAVEKGGYVPTESVRGVGRGGEPGARSTLALCGCQ